jgi:fructose/tagatose bisphosphate aldolase
MFNECPFDDWVKQSIRAGFNLVMLADPDADYEDYRRRVAELTRLAHQQGAAVEAEIGELPCGLSAGSPEGGSATDPDLAAAFVGDTDVDLLAVSVGNVHVQLQGQRALDLDRLAEIARKADVPLALHGGTGIAADSLGKAIVLGVRKVAFGTCLKHHCLARLRDALGHSDEVNPHRLLGEGGEEDLLTVSRQAARDVVLQRIAVLGCCGKA